MRVIAASAARLAAAACACEHPSRWQLGNGRQAAMRKMADVYRACCSCRLLYAIQGRRWGREALRLHARWATVGLRRANPGLPRSGQHTVVVSTQLYPAPSFASELWHHVVTRNLGILRGGWQPTLSFPCLCCSSAQACTPQLSSTGALWRFSRGRTAGVTWSCYAKLGCPVVTHSLA